MLSNRYTFSPIYSVFFYRVLGFRDEFYKCLKLFRTVYWYFEFFLKTLSSVKKRRGNVFSQPPKSLIFCKSFRLLKLWRIQLFCMSDTQLFFVVPLLSLVIKRKLQEDVVQGTATFVEPYLS